MKLPIKSSHPKGEEQLANNAEDLTSTVLDTFGGKVHVEWDPQRCVTALGQLSYFIEFLKTGDLFDPWVSSCPLNYTSNNATSNRDLLGTIMLSILSGHTRYAHISRLKCDTVNPPLLGMNKVASEDAVRRGLIKLDEVDALSWLQKHLHYCYQPLLSEPWILDIDTTVKVLYGHQEGAVVGYNPHKRGRPSHTYHTYMMSNIRLILGVEVQAGNESSSKHTAPGLWDFLLSLPRNRWPTFLRGDCNFGNEAIMEKAEELSLDYLFKLKCTAKVKQLIKNMMRSDEWFYAGQGWDGVESTLQLTGWSRARRVIVMRKKISKNIVVKSKNALTGQFEIQFGDLNNDAQVYEYSVLVTSLPDEILTLAQHYRDRADSENNFDELKNQWGWCGFTTSDIKRCRVMANMISLIFNWWTLFVRLAIQDKHAEAITSRPLLLQGVARKITHARQTTIVITNAHADSKKAQTALNRIARFFKTLISNAEQLTPLQRWYRILSYAFAKYLKGKILKPPMLLTG